jgi:hypothetical protein
MRIERTPGIETPSRIDIVRSGLNEHFSAVSKEKFPERYGYRGDAPQSLARAPKGWLLVMEQGLIFLAKSEKNLSPADFLKALADEAASRTLGVLGSLDLTTIMQAGDGASRIDEMLAAFDHPDSFIIPFTEVVEARYERTGSWFTGYKHFLMLKQEWDDGEFKFVLSPAESDLWITLFWYRLNAEVKLAFLQSLRDVAETDNYLPQMMQAFSEAHPDASEEETAAAADAASVRIRERLELKGTSMDRLLAEAAVRVADHFGDTFREVPWMQAEIDQARQVVNGGATP